MQENKIDGTRLRIPIIVNRERFEWDQEEISGLEILDLAHEAAADYKVYIKRQGRDDDPVGVDQRVNLRNENDRKFRTIPKEVTEG